MSSVVYLSFSTLEWASLIVLAFAMFKIPLRGYWGQLLLSSFVLSLLSHFVFNSLEVRPLSTLLQPPVVFLFLWQMFRIQVFYAAMITVYGYLGYIFTQSLLIVGAKLVHIPTESIVPGSIPMYSLQFATAFTVSILAFYLYKNRLGYSFVPDCEYVSVTLRGLNLQLLLLMLAGYAYIVSTNYISFSLNSPQYLSVVTFIVLAYLLYYALKKENAQH